MKKLDKVKVFVKDHKTVFVTSGIAIISAITGYTLGNIIQAHTSFNYLADSVVKSTEASASAGVRIHYEWIRENVPEAYKAIKSYIKENPGKYNVKERLSNDQTIKMLGDSIGKNINFEIFE